MHLEAAEKNHSLPATLLLCKHLKGNEQVLAGLSSEHHTPPGIQESSSKSWLKESVDVEYPLCTLLSAGDTVKRGKEDLRSNIKRPVTMTMVLFLAHGFSFLYDFSLHP